MPPSSKSVVTRFASTLAVGGAVLRSVTTAQADDAADPANLRVAKAQKVDFRAELLRLVKLV